VNHVDLGLWADVMIIAPASGNTVAKMANGRCDNLLTAVYLSARCPVFVAPAMDLDMLAHPSTLANFDKIRSYGNTIIDPVHGELASGLVGDGRMAEPEEILDTLQAALKKKSLINDSLAGKSVLITAGPTHEAIDPVRFIGNHSSGKMGFALAEKFADAGALVTLVTGPTNEQCRGDIKRIDVTSAEEMYRAAADAFPAADITVLAAAVADYRPAKVESQKIKKNGEALTLELTKTIDIAESLGKIKSAEQLLVGFALETDNETANARDKLTRKNFDLIVLNSLQDSGAGFGFDTNKITIIDRHNGTREFPLKSKAEVADDILAAIASFN